uniref:Immunoglobulin domain-containing protein n=1 Tax=Astyanax mexicanus TaxID=7994 RepID=A0A3B1JXH4_ASTMX
MDVWSLLSGSGASSEVKGYSGGGVLIKCKYDRSYTRNNKYFCKSSGVNCDDLIRTGDQEKSVHTERFSMINSTSSAEFWVMIRELTVEDSGRYQCGVYKASKTYKHIQVELKINEDQHHEKCIDGVGYKGESLNITCKYPQSLKDHPKFFCFRVGSGCLYKAAVKQSKIWTTIGKFSLYDNRETDIFTVRFNLTKGDSGEYWCGAESDWESDHGYKVYFTQINLRVTAEPGQPDTSTPSRSFTQPSMKTTLKNSEQPQQRLVTTNTPTTEFPTFFVITVVSVILVLLLIGLLVFVVILQKRVKARASTSIQSTRGSSNTNTVYEEIKDTKRHPSPDSGASTVHQLPTNPSDPSHTLYDNVQIRQCPNPIYSTAPDQNINSTPQIPTSSSGSSASTTEDPAYATVKFTKNYNVTAKVNMKEESCDYATVKHASGSG